MLTVNHVNFKVVNLTLIVYNYKRKSGAPLVPHKDRLYLTPARPKIELIDNKLILIKKSISQEVF